MANLVHVKQKLTEEASKSAAMQDVSTLLGTSIHTQIEGSLKTGGSDVPPNLKLEETKF